MTDHWQVIEDALRERHERLMSTLDRWQEGSAIYQRRLAEANELDAALAFVREMRQGVQPMPVEVHPPQHLREHVAMELGCDIDELRFVLYNDTAKGEWLDAQPKEGSNE